MAFYFFQKTYCNFYHHKTFQQSFYCYYQDYLTHFFLNIVKELLLHFHFHYG